MAGTANDNAGPRRQWAAFPVVYMFGLTFVSTLVLVGLSRFTDERVRANRQIRFERAVLQAVGIEAGAGVGSARPMARTGGRTSTSGAAATGPAGGHRTGRHLRSRSRSMAWRWAVGMRTRLITSTWGGVFAT